MEQGLNTPFQTPVGRPLILLEVLFCWMLRVQKTVVKVKGHTPSFPGDITALTMVALLVD